MKRLKKRKEKNISATGEEVKIAIDDNGFSFNSLWLAFVKRLSKKTKSGKPTFDFIIFYIRKVLDILGLITIGVGIVVFLLTAFRVALPVNVFLAIFTMMIVMVPISLWLGLTNANITSIQLNILFKRGREKTTNRKYAIKKYSFRSFYIAIALSILSVIFIENNFVMAIINNAYVSAKNFLLYTNSPVKFYALEPLLFGGQAVNVILMILPLPLYVILIKETYKREILRWDKLLQFKLNQRFYKAPEFTHLLNKQDEDDRSIANLVLGTNAKTGQIVSLNPETRLFNTFFIGPTGSGKGVAVANNLVIQDAETAVWYFRKHWQYVSKTINKINGDSNLIPIVKKKKIESELENWYTSGVAKDMLNGFYVNEPAGNLAESTINILHRMGIPEDMIWVIDPTEKYTEGINVLDQSIEKASGSLSEIARMFMEEGGSNNNPFFTQAGEAFIRSLVVIVKVTAQMEGSWIDKRRNGAVPTLTQINEVIDDTKLLKNRLALFNEYIKLMDKKQLELTSKYNEHYNKALKEWINQGNKAHLFDKHLQKEKGNLYEEREVVDTFNEQYAVYKTAYNSFVKGYFFNEMTGEEGFRQEQYVSGLKNVFTALTSSQLAQRVLFRNQTKNIDVWLKAGGFIVVNTARGDMDDATSRRVGKLINKVVQDGTLRREPEVSPLFSQLTDENAWIITEGSEDFANQIRKFHSPMLGLFQNYDQVQTALGDKLTSALFNSYRNGFVFQDGSKESVDIVAQKAGTKFEIKKTITQNSEDTLAGNDDNSVSVREEITEVEALNRTEIIHQEQFSYTGIYVENNEVSEVTQIIPTEYFYRPIFSEDWKPIFDIQNNKDDKDAFEWWKKEVEKLDEERYKENIIPLSEFDKEAQDIITGNYDTERGIYKGKSIFSFFNNAVSDNDDVNDKYKKTSPVNVARRNSGKPASEANEEAKAITNTNNEDDNSPLERGVFDEEEPLKDIKINDNGEVEEAEEESFIIQPPSNIKKEKEKASKDNSLEESQSDDVLIEKELLKSKQLKRVKPIKSIDDIGEERQGREVQGTFFDN